MQGIGILSRGRISLDTGSGETFLTGTLTIAAQIYEIFSDSATFLITSGDTPTEMQLSEDGAFAGAVWEPYRTTVVFTTSAGKGLRRVYVRVKDATDATSRYPRAAAVMKKALVTRPVSTLMETTITVKRMAVDPGIAGNTNEFGETVQAWTTISTSIKARIEAVSGRSSMRRTGRPVLSTHRMFVLDSADVQEKDEVTDNETGRKYLVAWANTQPGGERSHHKEIDLRAVNYV